MLFPIWELHIAPKNETVEIFMIQRAWKIGVFDCWIAKFRSLKDIESSATLGTKISDTLISHLSLGIVPVGHFCTVCTTNSKQLNPPIETDSFLIVCGSIYLLLFGPILLKCHSYVYDFCRWWIVLRCLQSLSHLILRQRGLTAHCGLWLHLRKQVLINRIMRTFYRIRSQFAFFPRFNQREGGVLGSNLGSLAPQLLYCLCHWRLRTSILFKISSEWKIIAFLTCILFQQVLWNRIVSQLKKVYLKFHMQLSDKGLAIAIQMSSTYCNLKSSD